MVGIRLGQRILFLEKRFGVGPHDRHINCMDKNNGDEEREDLVHKLNGESFSHVAPTLDIHRKGD